jgi:hypothetical protein
MTRTPLVTTMMPVDTIKIGERIGRGLGDLPSLTADFAIDVMDGARSRQRTAIG